MAESETTPWVLTFVDGGRAILTTTQQVERETYDHVREMWRQFVTSTDEIMIIGGCTVERRGRVELEIGTDAIIVRGRVSP